MIIGHVALVDQSPCSDESGARLECRGYAYSEAESVCYLREYGEEANEESVGDVKVYTKLCVPGESGYCRHRVTVDTALL